MLLNANTFLLLLRKIIATNVIGFEIFSRYFHNRHFRLIEKRENDDYSDDDNDDFSYKAPWLRTR